MVNYDENHRTVEWARISMPLPPPIDSTVRWYIKCSYLFCVSNFVGIFIDYLANLENFVANLLKNLEIFQRDKREIFRRFPRLS